MRTSADSTSWLRAALARTPGALGRPARQPTDTVRLMIAQSATAGLARGSYALGAAELLGQAGLACHQPLQALRGGYAQHARVQRELAAAGVAAPPADQRVLRELGQHIAGLLPEHAGHAIMRAAQQARARRRRLRIVIEVAHDALAALSIPWELMALPGGHGESLLLDAGATLVRQVRGVGRPAPRRLNRPLRVQAVAAAPAGSQTIDLAAALAVFEQAPAGQIAADWYAGPGTLGQLQARLQARRPQVVHVLCHGEPCDTGRGQPRCDLLLTHTDGNTQRVGATELARVLALAPQLQLVMLQCCHAGSTLAGPGAAPPTDSIALTLVRYGVPAVVAMQGEVSQPAANAFARACYAGLAQGDSIGQAVAAGRVAMLADGSSADWALPVLYTGWDRTPAAWLRLAESRF